MKSDVERKIEARVAKAFQDVVPVSEGKTEQEILQGIQALVRAVWVGKIYAALPKDKTKVPEYFLDAELEQLLNEAVDECYKMICLIADRAKEDSRG